LGSDLYADQQVIWDYQADDRTAGYHVYEQSVGETGFHHYLTVDMSLADGMHWSYGGNEGSGQQGVHLWIDRVSGWISVIHRLEVSLWTVGTYHFYVVPVDADGLEGPPSPVLPMTLVSKLTLLMPEEGAVTSEHPAFEWVDAISPIQGPNTHGVYRTSVYDESRPEASAIWAKSSQMEWTSVLHDGNPLVSGQKHFVIHDMWMWYNLRDPYDGLGATAGRLHERVGFTVE